MSLRFRLVRRVASDSAGDSGPGSMGRLAETNDFGTNPRTRAMIRSSTSAARGAARSYEYIDCSTSYPPSEAIRFEAM